MLPTILFYIVLTVAFGFGLNYIFRSKWMPYHEKAFGMKWGNLNHKQKTLIKVFLKLVGAGWISTSISSLIIFLISKDFLMALFPLFILNIFTTYGSNMVKEKTKGNPPVWLSIITLVLMIICMTFSFI